MGKDVFWGGRYGFLWWSKVLCGFLKVCWGFLGFPTCFLGCLGGFLWRSNSSEGSQFNEKLLTEATRRFEMTHLLAETSQLLGGPFCKAKVKRVGGSKPFQKYLRQLGLTSFPKGVEQKSK